MSGRLCIEADDSVIASGFLESFDYVLTDCDGVLWMEKYPIPGSLETIQALKSLDDIFPTSFCAAAYLLSKHFKKKVYVIGSSGITDELDIAKIQYIPIGPDDITNDDFYKWISELELDPEVGAVVVGFDPNISYPKLLKAASYLKNPDILFLVTHRDEKYPVSGDVIIPATGTFLSVIEVASGRTGIAVGKPERFLLDCIKHSHPQINFSRCIMIGDRLDTDVVFGTKYGLKSLLVLTGINSIEDVRQFEKSTEENDHLYVPDYYLPCLGDLEKFIKL